MAMAGLKVNKTYLARVSSIRMFTLHVGDNPNRNQSGGSGSEYFWLVESGVMFPYPAI
jgi:hypothetical protein